jgi:hypothetical protein
MSQPTNPDYTETYYKQSGYNICVTEYHWAQSKQSSRNFHWVVFTGSDLVLGEGGKWLKKSEAKTAANALLNAKKFVKTLK